MSLQSCGGEIEVKLELHLQSYIILVEQTSFACHPKVITPYSMFIMRTASGVMSYHCRGAGRTIC